MGRWTFAGVVPLACALAACGGGGGGSAAGGNVAHRVPSQAAGASIASTPGQAVGASQACPTGELFTANGAGWVAVHDRMAFGDRPPLRTLAGASTGFVTGDDTSAPRGVAVDVAHDELLASAGKAIRVFPRAASGDVAPVRTIAGATTGLALAGKIAVDAIHDELWVVDGARLRVFARSASGDAAPLRTLTGAAAFADVAVDATVNDEVVAVSSVSASVVVYARTASGVATPVRTLAGPATLLRSPRAVAVDAAHGELFVLDWASDASTSSVSTFSRTASGDAAPLRRIVGALALLSDPTDIAHDAERDELLVASGALPAVIAFGRTQAGDVQPRRVLAPSSIRRAAGLASPQAIAIAPATASCAAGHECAAGGCKPAGARDCGEGHYCDAARTCEQLTPAMVCDAVENPPRAPALCPFDTTCPTGWVCATGGCMPAGATDCGSGTYCGAGLTCSIWTQQCTASGGRDCGNGRFCPAGATCTAGGMYCQPAGAVDCGSGWYCDAGLACAASGGGYVCNPPGSGGGAYCYSTSACILGAYGTCNCSGAASQTQCLSGHPPCAGVGSACGDGVHACCGGETCVNGRCESGCGRCAGNGCTP